MFTLPPKPPKDYILKKVGKTQASAPEHTPFALPRATQTTLGRYCYPIPASDDEPTDKSAIIELDDRILNRMTETMRAWRIDKPGSNAYFLTDLYRKTHVDNQDNDPRYQHKPKVFQRSYKYELDCIEEMRLNKLWAKVANEEEEENRQQQKYMMKEKAKQKPTIGIVPCKFDSPFWWKHEHQGQTLNKFDLKVKPNDTTYQSSYLRWQNEPSLFEPSQTDPCKRRETLMLVGQPFKHEACSWYLQHYPPPNIKFIPEKFSH